METKMERKTTIQDLGDDLMVEIISWLPLKSIVLCLGVCKQWQSLISDGPFFLTNTINVAHLHYDDTYICHRRCQRGGGIQDSELPFSIKSLDKSLFAHVYDCGVFAGSPIYDYGIFATCNGLLIYGVFIRLTKELRECYISNPWTREYVPFEKPSYPRPIAGWGLAFENNPINSNSRNTKSSNNNAALYKIVVVHYTFEDNTYLFEVRSSDKNRWRLIQSAIKFCYLRLNSNAFYCRRVLYWQCCEKQALMFNLEKETPDYLELPRDADNDHATAHSFLKSKLVECHGQLHCIRLSSGGSRLSIWKMSTTSMSDGWLILHNVDLRGAMERSLDVLDPEHEIKINNLLLAFSPIDMNCEGDDKVLLDCVFFLEYCNYCMIVSYDLKRAAFELIFKRDPCREVKFFRYTPTNKTISVR